MRSIRLILLIACVLLGATSVTAQTRATSTTLGAALSSTAQTMTVSSGTGFTVGNYAFLDAELVRITSVNGTTIGIQRGQSGTAAAAHANGETVLTGNIAHFQTTDPFYAAACTPGSDQATYAPWINVLTGTIWKCLGPTGTASTWNGTRTAPITYNSIQTGAQ